MTKPRQPENNSKGMSRRNFLKNGGLLAGGLVGGSLFGGLLTNKMQQNENEQPIETTHATYEARTFFTRNDDFDVLSAATERLFPKDEIGAGAIELGVPYFIDRQLSGEWGTNSKEYMYGPFPQTVAGEEYRYHSRMTRAEIFMEGIHAIEQTSQEKFGERFKKLEPAQQDEILQLFEDGKAKMNGITSTAFFNLLLQTSIEGLYADPVYGGNRNMDAWRMKEYPGPRMSYMDEVYSEEFILMEPEPLRNYQGHGH